ncbi:MAG: helix-turn-helix transcriptional regulator [Clostridia bacterium]|nr:helix-turn-helix transcriptional regulator [Clostridia bacterium]
MQEDKNDNLTRNDLYELSEDDAEQSVTPTTETEAAPKSDDASSISADLIRGHINTIILRALYERDKYGYEIMNDIEVKSHGQYSLKQPTLYSALKRLETQGYIKAFWKTDEVSSGGRRKYFTLTESGRDITEKNLAEWEYSRTIIDSLISDRSFDFSQPAPTPVDFTILRNSVSRVPIVRTESNEADDLSDEQRKLIEQREQHEAAVNEQLKQQQELIEQQQEIIRQQQQLIEQHNQEQLTAAQTQQVTQQQTETVQEAATPQQETAIQQNQQTETSQEASTVEQSQQQTETTAQSVQQQQQMTPEETAQAEARRIAHENYMRLISEPVREPEPVREDVVPNSENVNTEKLIYNNRPETERDYKNLIDGIFRRAVSNGSVQTFTPPQPKPKPIEQPQPRVKLIDRGRADGVAVADSSTNASTTYATKTTYNKGRTLLKCSSVVFSVTLIEAIFCFVFLNQLNTSWVYPTVILTLGLVQFAVFGIMALQGYGKNCVRPTSNNYISTCVILTVIAILIISALSFLLNINPTIASDIMKMIVIPSITALNITVFAVCFKIFIK